MTRPSHMTAKRKKSDHSPPRQAADGEQAGRGGAGATAFAGAAFAPLGAAMSSGGVLSVDSPTAGSPFVFSAGVGASASESGRVPSTSPPPRGDGLAGLPSSDELTEVATQRLVEACRAGDPVTAAIRLPAAAVNAATRQGAATGFSAPPLWWCAHIQAAAGAVTARLQLRVPAAVRPLPPLTRSCCQQGGGVRPPGVRAAAPPPRRRRGGASPGRELRATAPWLGAQGPSACSTSGAVPLG